MSVLEKAFEDIKIAISSDIVHKYLLTNAPDMVAVANLASTCARYDGNLFGWAVSIAHAMVNPRVLAELSSLIDQHKGDKRLILVELMQPQLKERWNTVEFHAEMQAVTSDYQKCGGYQLTNSNAGIAAEILSPDFAPQLEQLSSTVSIWLNAKTQMSEDALIQAVFDLKIPGMNDDINGYWLLHFCRWISFARNKVLDLPIDESQRYLGMIGVRLFKAHYQGLTQEDLLALFRKTQTFVAQIELRMGRADPKMTYGDFGCLACETHRMLDQLKKELGCDEDTVRKVLHEKLDTSEALRAWLEYKKTQPSTDVAPSIWNSARYNSTLFATAAKRPDTSMSSAIVEQPLEHPIRRTGEPGLGAGGT